MSDISELFARDPLKLTNDDITEIIVNLRKMREQFLLGAKSAGKVTSTKKLKEAPTNIDLKDLGL